MSTSTLPPTVDTALVHAVCKSPVWGPGVDIATLRRILALQLETPEDGAVNLSPIFRYLANAGPQGSAARCVREVAEGMEAVGIASFVPDLTLRRGPVTGEVTKPERRRVISHAQERLPLLVFACFMSLMGACFVLASD